MASVTRPIQSGDYYISSRNGRAWVALLDDNKGTPFTVTSKVDDINKLHVEKRSSSEEYKISSIVYLNEATVPRDVSPGTEVITGSTLQEWFIDETDIKGQYVVYVQPQPGKKIYWHLVSTNPGTPITVTDDLSKAEYLNFQRVNLGPETRPIQSGDYYISSRNGRAWVALLDDNKGTAFTVTSRVDDINKLHVEKGSSSEKYKISSIVYLNEATVPRDVSPGTEVITGSTLQDWFIDETDIKGQYVVYVEPSKGKKIYWHLVSTNPGTPVTVTDDLSKAEKLKFERIN